MDRHDAKSDKKLYTFELLIRRFFFIIGKVKLPNPHEYTLRQWQRFEIFPDVTSSLSADGMEQTAAKPPWPTGRVICPTTSSPTDFKLAH